MKSSQGIRFWHLYFFACCIFVFVNSCDPYNFSQSQPVDRENIYEFPEEFQGNWIPENDNNEETVSSNKTSWAFQPYQFTGSNFQSTITKKNNAKFPRSGLTENDDSILYLVDKKYALFIMYTKEKILTGAWPKLSNQGDFLYPPNSYNSIKEIEYDSLRRPTDAIDNYVLRGSHIYEVDDKGLLGKGYSYLSSEDGIIVIKNDTICIDLGQNAFLRKLNANFYVLNIRKSVLGEGSDWWRIMIFEKSNDQSFKIWECTSKSGKLPSMFYSKDSKFYFDSKWTSAEMLRLIDERYFKISAVLIKNERMTVQK